MVLNRWSIGAIVAVIVVVGIAAVLVSAHQSSTGREAAPVSAAAKAHDANTPGPADTKTREARKTPASPKLEGTSGRISGAVEVTGCLHRGDEAFVLKDTEGAAPTSRSWKTAFLKKTTTSLELKDGNGAHLADHVGQRVSVMGNVIDREMNVQSIRRVAATCR